MGKCHKICLSSLIFETFYCNLKFNQKFALSKWDPLELYFKVVMILQTCEFKVFHYFKKFFSKNVSSVNRLIQLMLYFFGLARSDPIKRRALYKFFFCFVRPYSWVFDYTMAHTLWKVWPVSIRRNFILFSKTLLLFFEIWARQKCIATLLNVHWHMSTVIWHWTIRVLKFYSCW
jgi:hypothetical protein